MRPTHEKRLTHLRASCRCYQETNEQQSELNLALPPHTSQILGRSLSSNFESSVLFPLITKHWMTFSNFIKSSSTSVQACFLTTLDVHFERRVCLYFEQKLGPFFVHFLPVKKAYYWGSKHNIREKIIIGEGLKQTEKTYNYGTKHVFLAETVSLSVSSVLETDLLESEILNDLVQSRSNLRIQHLEI